MTPEQEEAFGSQLALHQGKLRAYARTLTRGGADTDDLMQETFLHAWAARDNYRNGEPLCAWLYTIMRNAHIDMCRQRFRTYERTMPDEELGNLRGNCPPPQDSFMDWYDFCRAFGRLPQVERDILTLVAAEGFDYKDAGKVLGFHRQTIDKYLTRGRAHLREALAVQ